MQSEIVTCFISHLQKFGSLLQVWVQKDHNQALYIEDCLLKLKSDLQYGGNIPRSIEDLHHGLICAAKFDDGSFYRTEIQHPEYAPVNAISALFIDYGNLSLIGLGDIRLFNAEEHETLIKTKPLAIPYIVSGVSLSEEWTEENVAWIKHQVQYSELTCTLYHDLTGQIRLISLPVEDKDVAQLIIENNLGKRISNTDLVSLASETGALDPLSVAIPDTIRKSNLSQRLLAIKDNSPKLSTARTAELKTETVLQTPWAQGVVERLPEGSSHSAYISHVEDGPLSFFVQLKKDADELLPSLIETLKYSIPCPNKKPLLPGSVCLGRCSIDKGLRRGVVMNLSTNSCKVYYTDFGDSEDLFYSDIYQLPQNIAVFPPLALHFGLAGVEASDLSETAKMAFKDLVLKKPVFIRVNNPATSSPARQQADLLLDGRNIRDVLPAKDAVLRYLPQSKPRMRDIKVQISFVENLGHFYVQYGDDEELLANVQASVATHCTLNPPSLHAPQVESETPIAALYNEDQTWYRAKVLESFTDRATVLYVDYGNKETVVWGCTVQLPRGIVEMARALAIECQLIGYEMFNPQVGSDVLHALEGEDVTLRLHSIGDNGILIVDIVTPKGDSLAQLLKPRVAVEPQLTVTQDGNRRTVVAGSTRQVKKQTQLDFYKSSKTRSSREKHRDLSGMSRYENNYEKQTKRTGFEGDSKNFEKFSNSREKYQTKSYYEHDNRTEDVGGGDTEFAKKARNQDRGSGKGAFKSTWKENEERSWNKSDDKKDNWKHEDRSFNKSDDTWKKTEERHDTWNKSDDRRDSWNKHEEKKDWNKQEDRRDSWKRHEDRKDNWNKPEERKDTWNNTDERRENWNRSDGNKRDSWNGERRDNKWNDSGSGRYNRDNQDGKFKRQDRGGGGGGDRRWRDDGERKSRWNDDKPKGRWGNDDGRKKWNRDDEGGNKRSNWRDEGQKKKWNKDDTLDYRRPADDFVQLTKVIKKTNDDEDEAWDESDFKDVPCISVPAVQLVSEYPRFVLDPGFELKVRVCHILNPEGFYVQGFGSDGELDSLRNMIDMDTKASFRSVPDKLLCVGSPVLARYSDDMLLYRGVIKQALNCGQSMNVLFIDYGNSQCISPSELFLPTEEMVVSEAQAIRCTLADIKTDLAKWKSLKADVTEAYFINFDYFVLRVEGIHYIDGELTASVVLTRPDGMTVSEVLVRDEISRPIDGKLLPRSTELKNLPELFGTTHRQPMKKEEASASEPQASNQIETNLPTTEKQEATICDSNIKKGVWNDRAQLLVGQYLYVTVIEHHGSGVFLAKVDEFLEILCITSRNQVADEVISQKPKAIMHVLKVLEDRILVTLFNADGTPMGTVTPKINDIFTITPGPIVYSKESVFVSHSEGNILYVQKSSHSNKINEMLDNLYTICEEMVVDYSIKWKPGDMCCANSSDGNWYRARIIKGNLVYYIDYGNTENLIESKIHHLPKNFKSLPELCIKCVLPIKPCSSNLSTFLINIEFDAFFYRPDPVRDWFIELCDKSGNNILKKLEKSGIEEDRESPFVEVNSPIDLKLEVGMKVPVVISHIDYPSAFWVHLSKHIDTIEKLQIEIQASESRDEMKNVFVAQYSADDTWYRATWEDVETRKVRFIDYGNVDNVTSFKPLPSHLIKPTTGYAIPVFLNVYPKGGSWAPESYELLEKFIDVVHEEAIIEIVSVRFKIVVELTIGGKSASKTLVEAGFATYDPTEAKVELNESKLAILAQEDLPKEKLIFVSHSNSVNDFYTTPIELSEELEGVCNYLSEAESFPKLSSLKETSLVVAQFPEDQQWYRAKILSTQPNITVHFIDYGNISAVTEIREMPAQFEGIPPYVIHCSLGIDNPTDETENKFMETHAQGITKFEMIIDKEGDPNMVRLKLNGESILKCLASVAEESKPKPAKIVDKIKKVFVCHSDGPDKFYIQYESDEEAIGNMAEMLTSSEDFEVIDAPGEGDFIATKFSEDDCWYRAKVISNAPTVEVFFIDYGNKSVVTEFRRLPQNILAIPPLAKSCSLEKPYPDMIWTAGAKEKFTELVNGGFTSFEMNVVKEDDPNIVQLVLNSYNIVADLIKYAMDHPSPRQVANEVDTDRVSNSSEPSEPVNNVYICYYNSPEDFYVQYKSQSANLKNMSLELQTANNYVSIMKPLVNDLVAAKFLEDENWYRAEVLTVTPTVNVRFIDYGNCAEVVDFKVLPADISALPPLAEHCALSRPENVSWSSEAIKKFLNMIDEGTALFQIETISEGNPKIVKLTLEDVDISEDLIKYSVWNPEVHLVSDEVIIEESEYIKTVVISFAEGPNHFYIQDNSKFIKLDKIAEILGGADGFESLETINEGDSVVAKFPEDESWYRAMVLSTNPEVLVKFVDFGNISDVKEWKKLPESIASESPIAVCCALSLPEGKKWVPKVKDKFLEMTSDSTIEYTVDVIEEGIPLVVQLIQGGENVNEILSCSLDSEPIEETEIPTKVERSDIIYVSHVNSPSDFYIHRRKNMGILQNMIFMLNKVDSFDAAVDPMPGDLVCAQFPDDLQWYRCLLKITKPEFEGLLVDFGSYSTVTDIKELPEELKSVEHLAEHCQLLKPDNLESWGKAAESKFLEFVNAGVTQMIVEIVNPDTNPKTVSLCINDTDILTEMIPVSNTDEREGLVKICHFDNPNNFYVQERCEELTEKITCALLEAENFEKAIDMTIGSKVCAKNEALWERAIVTELSPEVQVFFMDCGLTGNVSDVRKLPEELADIPALVKRCTMRAPGSVSSWSHEAQLKFADFVGLGNEMGGMRMITIEEGDPAIVDLLFDSESLSESLDALAKPSQNQTSQEEPIET